MDYTRWLQDLSRADFLKSAGLYLTPDRLFFVRLRKSLFRLSVIEEEAREIPLAGEGASRRQALSEAIRSLIPHFDPAREPLHICLSPSQTVVSQFFLPRVAAENLSKVLEYEIERQLPFRRQDVYYDFLPIKGEGDKLGLVLFAVPKKILDELLDILAALGIRPKGVETTATALSNYVLFCAGGIAGPALILGGQNQAWEMIALDAKGNGRGQRPEIFFSHLLPAADWAHGPGRELFHGCFREPPRFFGWGYIADLLLSVGEGTLEVEDLLALGKKRLAGNKEIGHPFSLPAVGAALRGLREGRFAVNLLPGAGKESESRLLSRLNAGLSVLLLIGLMLWGASYPVKDEIRLRQLQKENQKLAPSVEALRREEEELSRVRKEISFVSGMKERRGEIIAVLEELSRIVPNSAYLGNLRYREGAVELQGSAENASGLVPILERSPIFRNVGFNAPSNRGRDNRENFSLKAELERPEDKKVKP